MPQMLFKDGDATRTEGTANIDAHVARRMKPGKTLRDLTDDERLDGIDQFMKDQAQASNKKT